jgi:ABC-type cobalamin/Fe3+-siderophores transport system ATPase subunit
MKIELSNGYAEIKDVYTRGIAKKVNEILMEGVEIETVNNESVTKGFSLTASEKAADHAMEKMVIKLVIDGKEMTPSIETFDELSNSDFKKIKEAIDKVALGEETPKE